MIELVSAARCIQCNLCVSVCPTNVFNGETGTVPTIARKQDCQTCYMCELYCPVDALYVSSLSDAETNVDEESLMQSGLLGSYRKEVGWGRGRERGASSDCHLYKPMQPVHSHPG